jgi:hypothetical protein
MRHGRSRRGEELLQSALRLATSKTESNKYIERLKVNKNNILRQPSDALHRNTKGNAFTSQHLLGQWFNIHWGSPQSPKGLVVGVIRLNNPPTEAR